MFPVILLIILILLIIIKNVRVVQQASAYVIERLGAYSTTWSVGLHVKIPFIERVAKVVSLKEQVADFPPQPVITKDNVTMQIDTVVYFQITDPKLYTYGVEQPMLAIESLSATTLRNIIGDLDLDQCLTSRDIINSKMRVILDEATAFADPDNEAKVQAAFARLAKGKTVLMIAHRLSTVANADCIYVVQDGQIAESGAKDELCAQNGLFARMWQDYQASVQWKVAKEG